MRLLVIKKKHVIYMLSFIILLLLFVSVITIHKKNTSKLNEKDAYQTLISNGVEEGKNQRTNDTEYFRPSNLPILNDRPYKSDFFSPFHSKKPEEIILPNELLKAPEDSIINFFSILKQAANPVKGKGTGCGTLGYGTRPYPIAYQFLSPDYQKRLSYDDFLTLFENILHLNLIKLHIVPQSESCSDGLRYFIEFETIEGSEKGVGYFAYYYGYICITKIDESYKISDINFWGEDYLCAPYHGWHYIAENVVDYQYGEWCSLVQERYETQQDNYVKNIYFKGTDGYEYHIQFFQLTNGKDIKIAQYRKKNKKDQWELIHLNPTDCLDLKKK